MIVFEPGLCGEPAYEESGGEVKTCSVAVMSRLAICIPVYAVVGVMVPLESFAQIVSEVFFRSGVAED